MLFKRIETKVSEIDDFSISTINDILHHISDVKKLREPQVGAIKTYLFLRYELGCNSFMDLLFEMYRDDFKSLCQYLSIDAKDETELNSILNTIQTEGTYKKKKYNTLYEALNLDYNSYILALTMGSGKTYLIASIIAIEYAISLDNETNDDRFVKNALIFAPGLTIVKQLKEIVNMDYSWVLPDDLRKKFLANITFHTETNIKPQLDFYNIIITNVEKLTYKPTRSTKYETIMYQQAEENLRVERIKGLKNLAIFSDEAHHTYGNKVGDGIKRTREVLNKIGDSKNLKCIVNTTGTPYSKKELLKETVFWYGLNEGIKDKILKSLKNGIKEYDYTQAKEEDIVKDIIRDFFKLYKNTTLPNKAKAKIGFYFKDERHLQENKHYIQTALKEIGQDLDSILINTQKSSKEELEEFDNINDPSSNKRVLLLIKKAMEGFDCPSLFATAIIRSDSSSDNFVLQSSTRCLRNIYSEDITARIYLSKETAKTLDKELQSNFNIQLNDLIQKEAKTIPVEIKVSRTNTDRIKLEYKQKTVIQKNINTEDINFTSPAREEIVSTATIHSVENNKISHASSSYDIDIHHFKPLNEVAFDMSYKYNLNYIIIHSKLQEIYKDSYIPVHHIVDLEKQIEALLTSTQESSENKTDIKYFIKKEGFEKQEDGSLVTYANVHKDKYDSLIREDMARHYTPYNFDSKSERNFLEKFLQRFEGDLSWDHIEDIYFTGGLTNPTKTDIYFDWQDTKGRHKKYYPDFIILKKTGEYIVVEIKAEKDKDNEEAKIKAEAVKHFENKNGSKMIKYEIIYVNTDVKDKDISTIVNLLKK